jgi:hypothetical protein
MADGSTTNYNLILPEIDGADGTWGVSLNSNLDDLDSLLSGGTDLVALSVTGTVTAGGLSVTTNNADANFNLGTGALNITTTSQNEALNIISTQAASSNDAPEIRIFRDVTGSVNNQLGALRFRGRDSGGTTRDFARVLSVLRDASPSSPKGRLFIECLDGSGTLANSLTIDHDKVALGSETEVVDLEVSGDVYIHNQKKLILEDTSGNEAFSIRTSINNVTTIEETGSGNLEIKGDALVIYSNNRDNAKIIVHDEAGVKILSEVSGDTSDSYNRIMTGNQHSGTRFFCGTNETNVIAEVVTEGFNVYGDPNTSGTDVNIESTTGPAKLNITSTYSGGTDFQNGAGLEIGALGKAYVDLKNPATDDVDMRMLHDGNSYVVSHTGFLTLKSAENGNSGSPVRLAQGDDIKLTTTADGINVTGTVEADGFSGTGSVEITDFVTDVSTNNNDTTVPTTAAVKSYVDTTGGGETLAQTLALGNTTGGTDLQITSGDVIQGAAVLALRHGSSAQTALQSSTGFSRIAVDEQQAALYYGLNANQSSEKLATTVTGVDVTGTVEADGFSGTGSVSITDFIDDDTFATATATNVPTAESVKAYVDANGGGTLSQVLSLGDTSGGNDIIVTDGGKLVLRDPSGTSDGEIYRTTALYIDDPSNVVVQYDGSNRIIAGSGGTTLYGTAVGAVTDQVEVTSETTTSGSVNLPVLALTNNATPTSTQNRPGAIALLGKNSSGQKVSYASFYSTVSTYGAGGTHSGSLIFTVADGSGATAPITDLTDESWRTGHSIALNINKDYMLTTGYIGTAANELRFTTGNNPQSIKDSADQSVSKQGYSLHMPEGSSPKVMSIGGLGPGDSYLGANKTATQFLKYRGQHLIRFSATGVTYDLPPVSAPSTISDTTANIGDVWQISNAGSSGSVTIDRDAVSNQTVYWVTGTSLTQFLNNPVIAVGGSIQLQAVGTNTYMIFNATGLSDA